MTDEDKALMERLRAWEPLVSTGYEVPAAGQAIYEAADRIEQLTAEVERLNQALKECVMEAANWARQAGEAKGKLEGSEMPGIVDRWKAENQELRSENARLREQIAKDIEVELSMCAIANDEASSEWIDGFEFAWKRVRVAMEKR